MISFSQKGDFKFTEKLFDRILKRDYLKILDKYGQMGVAALAANTPTDTGKTAASWDYVIEHGRKSSKIIWTNDNLNDGVNIAVILQYGHATNNGGYVEGIDYINPALRPIFNQIVNSVWEEVTKS